MAIRPEDYTEEQLLDLLIWNLEHEARKWNAQSKESYEWDKPLDAYYERGIVTGLLTAIERIKKYAKFRGVNIDDEGRAERTKGEIRAIDQGATNK